MSLAGRIRVSPMRPGPGVSPDGAAAMAVCGVSYASVAVGRDHFSQHEDAVDDLVLGGVSGGDGQAST